MPDPQPVTTDNPSSANPPVVPDRSGTNRGCIVEPCVYTTQSSLWLDAARVCDSSEPIWFRSGRAWSMARQLLRRHGTLPLLIRRQEDSTKEFACTFIAELCEIIFPDKVGDAAAKVTWIQDHLLLQQREISRLDRTKHFPTWESQFQEWEIDNFLKAKTWYMFRNLRAIEAVPLPAIRKFADGNPLSADYIRGYAICHFPAGSIRVSAAT